MPKTLQPVVRILRTLLAVVIAVASVIPWLVGIIEARVQLPDALVALLAQIVVVCVVVTALFATPVGNRVLRFIGLNAATVDKQVVAAESKAGAALMNVTADASAVTSALAAIKGVLPAPAAHAIEKVATPVGDIAAALVAQAQADPAGNLPIVVPPNTPAQP